MAPGPLGVGIADGDVRCLLGTSHAHVWTRSLAGCRGRVVAGTPLRGPWVRHRREICGKTKKRVYACVISIGQAVVFIIACASHGSSSFLCTFDAFMRSHLAKQLVANKGVSAHRLIFGFVGSGPIVDASTRLQHGRGT